MLEAGWATQQTHGAGDLLELALTRDSESRVGSGCRVQDHLREACGEVNGSEDGAAGSADFTNAFAHILHGVLVSVRLLVEGSEVLYQPDIAVFFHDSKDGAVVPAASRLDDTKLDPLQHMSFDLLAVSRSGILNWFM
jgi:hypothetical protein